MNLSGDTKYQLLIEISKKLRDTFNLNEILEHLLDTIKTVVDYDAGGIFVLNQDLIHGKGVQPRGVIAGMIYRGYDPRPVENDPMLKLGKGIVGHVIFSGTSLVVPDVRLDSRYVEARKRTQSEIAVPIIRDNHTIGALNLENDHLAAYDESDLEVLLFFADAASLSIEKAMLHRQLLEKEILDKQLQLAKEVQFSLFPDGSLNIKDYDIAGICIPTEEVGGDYYDFIKLTGNRLGIAIADISGHGIAPAMVMTAFRGMLRTHASGKLTPAKIARVINQQLPKFSGDSHFITAVLIDLNCKTHEFTYVSCGHQPPLLLDRRGNSRFLNLHGPALGIINKVNFPTDKQTLDTCGIVVLYTDGVIEITSPEGLEYGPERLKRTIKKERDLPAAEIVQKVIQDTRKFSGSQSYLDDFTLVIIKRV